MVNQGYYDSSCHFEKGYNESELFEIRDIGREEKIQLKLSEILTRAQELNKNDLYIYDNLQSDNILGMYIVSGNNESRETLLLNIEFYDDYKLYTELKKLLGSNKIDLYDFIRILNELFYY